MQRSCSRKRQRLVREMVGARKSTLVLARERLTLLWDQKREWHAKNETDEKLQPAEDEEEEGEERGSLSRTRLSRLERVRDSKNRRPAEKRLDSSLRPAANEGMGSPLSFPLHSFTSLSIRLSASLLSSSPILCFPWEIGPVSQTDPTVWGSTKVPFNPPDRRTSAISMHR